MMAIELEIPADMESVTWSSEGETASTAAADQAVGLLEAEIEPEVMDEGREIEGLDGETIPIADETIDQSSETISQNDGEPEQEKSVIWPVDISAKSSPGKLQLQSSQEIAQAAWKLQIRGISDELAEAALERLTAEATYKAAKAREKSVLERLAEAMHKGPQIMPLFDRNSPAAESVAPDAATWQEAGEQSSESLDSPITIEPLTDDDWRSVPISELDLKPKLNERLEEAGATTIGHLEDLRAEISQGREKWPKGIGKAKITEIEDAVIEWLSRNRDKQVLAEAKTIEHPPACANQPAETTPAYHSGMEAYQKGWKAKDCPYVELSSESKEWLAGWQRAYDSDL